MNRWVGGLAVAAASLTLAACGGDDDETLSKADFIKQADAICTEADKKTDAIPEPTDAASLKESVAKAKPIVEEQIGKLKDLTDKAPEDVKADYEKAMAVLEQQPGVLDEFSAAGADQAKLQAVTAKIERLSRESDQLAKNIGLTECGT